MGDDVHGLPDRRSGMFTDSERLIRIETMLEMISKREFEDKIPSRVMSLEKQLAFYRGALWLMSGSLAIVDFLLHKYMGA